MLSHARDGNSTTTIVNTTRQQVVYGMVKSGQSVSARTDGDGLPCSCRELSSVAARSHFTGLPDQHGTAHACAVPIFFRLMPRCINPGAAPVRRRCSVTTTKRAAKIAALNDALRRDPGTGEHGRIVMTCGVSELGIPFTLQALAKLKAFNAFGKDNDPYGEHDFGSFELEGENLFWKIDYFEKDSDYMAGAETPEDGSTTDRMLTIMLAEEY